MSRLKYDKLFYKPPVWFPIRIASSAGWLCFRDAVIKSANRVCGVGVAVKGLVQKATQPLMNQTWLCQGETRRFLQRLVIIQATLGAKTPGWLLFRYVSGIFNSFRVIFLCFVMGNDLVVYCQRPACFQCYQYLSTISAPLQCSPGSEIQRRFRRSGRSFH